MNFLRLAFQDPHDCNYCVPIPCRRWHTEQFVDLAKIADRFHMTTVDSEDESILRRDDSQEPLPVGRKCDWNGRPDAAGLRQDAHESNDIRACRLSRKRIFHLQADKITGIAERNFRFERQLLEQFSTELRSRYRFTNHKRARRAHIDDIIVAQFSCEDTWTKRPVSTNIDTSEENNKSHTGIILELSCIRVCHACTTASRLGRVLLGAVYGFVDGVVAGLGLGWLYSAFDGGTRAVSR